MCVTVVPLVGFIQTIKPFHIGVRAKSGETRETFLIQLITSKHRGMQGMCFTVRLMGLIVRLM